MTGSYNLVLSNKSLRYELTIDRQVTIIKGDSATGKTTLVKYFTEASRKDSKAMHCNMSDKLEVITASSIEQFAAIEKIEHDKIFIADENNYITRTKEFAEIVNNSDNYYIIITRSANVKWLTCSVDSVFELKTENKDGKYVTKLSKWHNKSMLTGIDF